MGRIGGILASLFIVGCIGYFIIEYYPETVGLRQYRRSVPIAPEETPEHRDDAQLDRYALDAPAQATQSASSLAAYLAAGANADRDKARLIFRWIAGNIAYDTYSAENPETRRKQASDAVLRDRLAVCEGYANLFDALAQAMGLESVLIGGYSKGGNYTPGQPFEKADHAWNAVKIDGAWRLLDATWGAGSFDEQGNFVRLFQEHFFLTPPTQFIYDHFPEDPQWQLIEKPLSLEEFAALPFVKPAFFRYQLAVQSHRQGVIDADAQLAVDLAAPDEVLLSATLVSGGTTLPDTLTMTQREQQMYRISALFPAPGDYRLRIFAKPRNQDGLYEWAMEYAVHARRSIKRAAAFPERFEAFYEHRAYLHEPLRGELAAGKRYAFSLRVPGAEEVAVILPNDEWQTLQKNGESFSGEAFVKSGDIGVYAKFPGNDQFSGLLRYRAL